MVHLVLQAECLGEVRGLDQRGDAALHGHVAAQEIGGTLENPRRIALEPRERVLGRHDGNVELLAQLDVIVDVLVRERILVPVKTQRLDGATDAQGLLVIVAPDRVEYQRVVVANA